MIDATKAGTAAQEVHVTRPMHSGSRALFMYNKGV